MAEMKKLDVKESSKLVLLGTGVVVLTPLISGFVGGIGFLATQIPALNVSIGQALSAGIAAYAVQWAIHKFME